MVMMKSFSSAWPHFGSLMEPEDARTKSPLFRHHYSGRTRAGCQYFVKKDGSRLSRPHPEVDDQCPRRPGTRRR